MRTSYVYRNGELYERGTEPPRNPPARSSLPCPAIRVDGMAPIRSMADGRMYDGKGAYYRSVKDAGCEIVGDDKAPFDAKPEFDPGPVIPDLKRAIQELS